MLGDIMTEKKLSRIERLEQELAEAKAKEQARQEKAKAESEAKLERMAARINNLTDRITEQELRRDELQAQYNKLFEEHTNEYGSIDKGEED